MPSSAFDAAKVDRRATRLTIPQQLLLQADMVIE